MIFGEQRFTLDRIVRLSLSAVVLVALVGLLNYLGDVLIPFAIAMLLAYLINPLVSFFQSKLHRRGLSVALALLIIFLAFILLGAILLPLITHEVQHAILLIKQLLTKSQLAERAAQRLPPDLWLAMRDLFQRPELRALLDDGKLLSIAQASLNKILPGLQGLLSGTASLLLSLVGGIVILLYLVFLLIDYDRVSGSWQELIPESYRSTVLEFIDDFHQAMRRYFRAQALVAGMTGLICALGFTLIGIPLGIFLGAFVGLLNMVPYLQIIAIIPAIFLAIIHALETGMSIWLVLSLTALVFVVAQIIQDGVLVPRIMGKVTGLSPVAIMLSLSIWGKILGLLGLIIALPVSFLLLAYYQSFLRRHAQKLGQNTERSPASLQTE